MGPTIVHDYLETLLKPVGANQHFVRLGIHRHHGLSLSQVGRQQLHVSLVRREAPELRTWTDFLFEDW